MRWNILPIGIFTLVSALEWWKIYMDTCSYTDLFVLISYASRWEHNIYKARKRELEILQSKLVNEDKGDRTF
jgi:hypothetical protein